MSTSAGTAFTAARAPTVNSSWRSRRRSRSGSGAAARAAAASVCISARAFSSEACSARLERPRMPASPSSAESAGAPSSGCVASGLVPASTSGWCAASSAQGRVAHVRRQLLQVPARLLAGGLVVHDDVGAPVAHAARRKSTSAAFWYVCRLTTKTSTSTVTSSASARSRLSRYTLSKSGVSITSSLWGTAPESTR